MRPAAVTRAQAIKNLTVVATHGRRRKYKVVGLTLDRVKDITFEKDGQPISLVDYFERTYSQRLRFTNLPALHVGPKEKNLFLPMELLRIGPAQRYAKNINERVKADMIKKCAARPLDRNAQIMGQLKAAQFDNDPCLKEFGLHLSVHSSSASTATQASRSSQT